MLNNFRRTLLAIIFGLAVFAVPQSVFAEATASFTKAEPFTPERYFELIEESPADEFSSPYPFEVEVSGAENEGYNGVYALIEIPGFNNGNPTQYNFYEDGNIESNHKLYIYMDDTGSAQVTIDTWGWANDSIDVPIESNQTFEEFHELVSSMQDFEYRWEITSVGDLGSDSTTYAYIQEKAGFDDDFTPRDNQAFRYTYCDEVDGYDSANRLYHNGECRTSTLDDASTVVVVNLNDGSYASGVRYSVVDGEIDTSSQQSIDIWYPQAAEDYQADTDEREQDLGESQVDQNTAEDDAVADDADNCQAGDFGWIICPASELLIGIVNFIQDEVIIPFLTISPLDASDDDPVFAIWKSVRLLANSLLGVVFLAFIFAQVASINIDAYAIRKILPRLLIVAVAIQISFYIVAYLVDITAIIGNGIGDLVTTPLDSSDTAVFSVSNEGGKTAFAFDIAALLAVLGIGGAAAVALTPGMIGLTFVSLLSIVPVLLMVFFTLVFRQVLVMILAIVSPVAFALWVLPNTEGLFKKWWSMLLKVLFMYPLIVLLFAGGALVAAVASAIGGVGATIIALAAIIAPLAMIPMTFKFAGTAMSGFANMVQSLSQRVAVGSEGDGGIAGALKPHAERRRRDFASGTHEGRFLNQNSGSRLSKLGISQMAARPGINKLGSKSRADAILGFNQQSGEIEKELEQGGLKYEKDVLSAIISGKTGDLKGDQKALAEKYKGNAAAKKAAFMHLADTGMADMDDFKSIHGALAGNKDLQSSVIASGASAASKTNIEFEPYKYPGVDFDPSLKGPAKNQSDQFQKRFTQVLSNAGPERWAGQKKVSEGAREHINKVLSAQTPADMQALGVKLSSDPTKRQQQIQQFKNEQQKLMQNVYMNANNSTVGASKQAVFQNIVDQHKSNYGQVIQQAQQQMRGGQGGPPTPPAGGGGGQGNPPQNPPGGAGQGGGGGQGGSPQNPNPPGGGQNPGQGNPGGIVTPNSPNWQNPNSSNLPGGGNQGNSP